MKGVWVRLISIFSVLVAITAVALIAGTDWMPPGP
jgi:hypothetical protein